MKKNNQPILLLLFFIFLITPQISFGQEMFQQVSTSQVDRNQVFRQQVIDSMKLEFISFAETSANNLLPGYGYYKNGEMDKAWFIWIGLPTGVLLTHMGVNESSNISSSAIIGFSLVLILPIYSLVEPIFSTPGFNEKIVEKWQKKYPEIIGEWKSSITK